nr:hypothetical protein [Tanacetum cinerariifolium]
MVTKQTSAKSLGRPSLLILTPTVDLLWRVQGRFLIEGEETEVVYNDDQALVGSYVVEKKVLFGLEKPIKWVRTIECGKGDFRRVDLQAMGFGVKCDNWKALVGSYVVETKVLLGLEKPIRWVRTIECGKGDFRRADLQAMGFGGMVGFFFVVVFYDGGFEFLEGEKEIVVLLEVVCQLTHDNVLFFGGIGGGFKD